VTCTLFWHTSSLSAIAVCRTEMVKGPSKHQNSLMQKSHLLIWGSPHISFLIYKGITMMTNVYHSTWGGGGLRGETKLNVLPSVNLEIVPYEVVTSWLLQCTHGHIACLDKRCMQRGTLLLAGTVGIIQSTWVKTRIYARYWKKKHFHLIITKFKLIKHPSSLY
jgi:hypothetical protein